MPDHSSSTEPKAKGYFPVTQWSVVMRARDGGDQTVAGALSDLSSTYWQPVYAYIRRSGRSTHDAEDLTQDFFAHLLAHNFFDNVASEKGKFRSFLLTCLKNFLSNDFRNRNAQKRGSGEVPLSLDFEDAERSFQIHPIEQLTPDLVFERQWVLTLLDSVLAALHKEYEKSGSGDLFNALKGGLTLSGQSASNAQIAERLGMQEGTVRVAAHRIKKRYRNALEAEVSRTIGEDESIETEIAYLLGIFTRP